MILIESNSDDWLDVAEYLLVGTRIYYDL